MTDHLKVQTLNDAFRRTFLGGRVMMTPGVQALESGDLAEVLLRVRTFDLFEAENDPHKEHDMGSFLHRGQRFFWKIDYYDKEMEHGSDNPADPNVTERVLTVMLATEY